MLLSMVAWVTDARSQTNFYHSNEIPVIKNGQVQHLAWAGGLNNPEFSNIDLNFDGIQDLFIFDRTNNDLITLIQTGSSGQVNFQLDFTYDHVFPDLKNWVLLADYNCDNKMDIFSSAPGGIQIHENTGTANNPSFAIAENLIYSRADLGSGEFSLPIYVSSVDIPAITDADGDGDLDIYTFSQSGTKTELYLNQGIENFGTCDSIDFTLANICYGMFSEGLLNDVLYIGDDDSCQFNVVNPLKNGNNKSSRHAGSSLCAFDIDDNGVLDIILGDIASQNLSAVMIGPSSSQLDSAFQIITEFPNVPNTVDLETFPTAYMVDVNNDGVKDLLASATSGVEADDDEISYYYKNNGSNSELIPEYVTNTFLVNDMIDAGSASVPHFVDYNADGLLDIVISNKGFYQDGGSYDSQLVLYTNTGTATAPSFTWSTDNFLNMISYDIGRYLHPTFGDIDGDGDIDIVMGNIHGTLLLFENTAGAGEPMDFDEGYTELTYPDNTVIDVDANSAPQLFDLNEDGKLDLIVGERNGNINYLENIGSTTNFQLELVTDSLGNINIDNNGDFIGIGIPFAYYNGNNIELVIGNHEGLVQQFDNISGNILGDYNLVTTQFQDIRPIEYSAPALADLNNDGDLDMILGSYTGGLKLYMGGVLDHIPENTINATFTLFPNPALDQINLQLDSNWGQRVTYNIYDPSGKMIKQGGENTNGLIEINTSNFAEGIYLLKIFDGTNWASRKFLIQK